jgi:hypothetical protein
LNLGGNTLTVVYDRISDSAPNYTPHASLSVQNGATLTVTGPGTLDVVNNTSLEAGGAGCAIDVRESTLKNNGAIINATSKTWAGLRVWQQGTATITNVDYLQAATGANVTVSSVSGGIGAEGANVVVTVNGNVRGYVVSFSGATVTVHGNVLCEGSGMFAQAGMGGTLTVNGNIINGSAVAWGGTVTVNGNITGHNVYGVYVNHSGMATINGNITLTGPMSAGVVILYNTEVNSSNITVNGSITAAEYIIARHWYNTVPVTTLTADQYDIITEKDGRSYRQFVTDGGNVFVRTGDAIPGGWLQAESNPFTDVHPDHWHHDYVSWASANGITTGTSATTFAPNDNVTRAQFATFLHRVAGKPPASPSAFADSGTIESWAVNAVGWASSTGITTGYLGDNTFRPGTAITREQIATMLYRYAESIGLDTTADDKALDGFPDSGRVSDWAKTEMQWAVHNGIITGIGGVTLAPQNNASRAETVTMINRFVDTFNIPAP